VKVLVIEDVPELSRLLEMTFELDDRFEPLGTATTADSALDMAREQLPDAVVLDMSIEGNLDGARLLPTLRELLPDARIVVFTGHDDPARRQQALESGASAYVVKGGDLETLLDALGGRFPRVETDPTSEAPTQPA
jgi:DNA-binding NarL/FixJ family response regulator